MSDRIPGASLPYAPGTPPPPLLLSAFALRNGSGLTPTHDVFAHAGLPHIFNYWGSRGPIAYRAAAVLTKM